MTQLKPWLKLKFRLKTHSKVTLLNEYVLFIRICSQFNLYMVFSCQYDIYEEMKINWIKIKNKMEIGLCRDIKFNGSTIQQYRNP